MADFSDLKQEIEGKIITSDELTYENEIKSSWNAAHRQKRPLAFVKVRSRKDVENAIRFCAKNELEVCISAGGMSGFCREDDAVVIDLTGMSTIQVDAEKKTAVIEGGAIVADIDEVLYGYGFVLPLASFSQLGIAGMALIGGTGFLSRHYGVLSDNVLEYDLVLANGESIKVSAEEHPELFWGMKGCGANFGVVTSMKFQVHNLLPSLVVGGSMFFTFSRAKDVVKMFRDYSVEVDDDCLSLYMLIHIASTGPELIVRLLYSGTLRRGGEVVQDLIDLTRPYRFNCGPVEHPDFQKQGDFLFPSGRFNYGVPGHVLTELKDVIIDNIFSCVQDIGSGHFLAGTIVYMAENFGGKGSQVGYDESSFPFRNNARYWIGLNASTKKEEDFEAVKDWSNHFQSINSEYGTPLYDGGDQEEIMDKLRSLKQQYDPNNMFHNNLAPIVTSE